MFLIAYSLIQVVQLAHIKRYATGFVDKHRYFSFNTYGSLLYVKYICYGLVFFHSLLQPLCYLRMKEFRTLMKKLVGIVKIM